MPSIEPVDAGAYVVFAGFLGDAPVFALGDGRVLRAGEAITAHDGGLLAAIATPQGLVSGGDDGRVVRIAASGAPETVAERTGKWIDRLAAGPSGSLAFASGRTVWVREGKGTTHEITEPRSVGGLAFLPKGNRLAIATYSGVRLVFPGTAGTPSFLEWKGSHKEVTVSPDGRFLVTVMQENSLHGWRIADGQHMGMTGYPAKVRSISWSAKGRYLASTGAPGGILWPFQSKDGPLGKAPTQLGMREVLATSVACHPTEEIVAIGYSDGMILLVRIADAEEVLLKRPEGGPISAMNWDAKGMRLAFGSEAGEAGVVDIAG